MKVIAHLLKAISSAAVYNPDVQVAPACILWSDRDRNWEAIIPRMQIELTELLVFGEYDIENRTGPAIWLRCVLAGKISIENETPMENEVKEKQACYRVAENIPIFYPPGISYAEQNFYSRAMQLVGDKNPRHHEFTVQLRAFDAAKSGAKVGVAALIALCTSILKRSVRGGLIIVGEINLGGSIEPVHNSVTIAEIAIEKGATSLLMPVACRRQLFDLSDDMATKVDIQFYSDARDALLKSISD